MTTGTKESCTCDKCRAMCNRPCWGTPAEIRALIDAGYGGRLMLDWWERDEHLEYTEVLSPACTGSEGRSAPFWPAGRCALQMPNGLCSIHSMKPTEGREACHDRNVSHLHLEMAKAWNTDEGRALVAEWREGRDL